MIQTILIDDHPVFIDGLGHLLLEAGEFNVVGKFYDANSLLNEVEGLKPDLLIIDIEMPRLNGLELVKRVRLNNKKVKILILTMHHELGFSQEAKQNGANGIITKSVSIEKLINIIHSICEGINYFPKKFLENESKMVVSEREIEIIKLLSVGNSNILISEKLKISALTVKTHRSNIQKKLKADNSLHMLRIAYERGFI